MSTIYRASGSETDSWVREYLQPRFPELVKPFLDALDLCRRAHSSGALTAMDAQKLLAHARSTRTPLGENAAAFLGELCDSQSAACEVVRTLASSSRVHERVNALVALDSCQAGELHVEILASALADRSARVRALAADKVVGHGVKSLIAELDSAIAREKDSKLRAELTTNRALLAYGYDVRHEGEFVYVTCRPPRWSSTFKRFSLAEFENEGNEWIAAHKVNAE